MLNYFSVSQCTLYVNECVLDASSSFDVVVLPLFVFTFQSAVAPAVGKCGGAWQA